MRKNLPFWAKAAVWGMLFFFAAGGWIMFCRYADAEKNAALAINKNNYIRLHILANSDSPQDQAVKLKVKDAVVDYLTPFVKNAASPLEARQIIKEQQEDILRVAQAATARDAAHYPVAMELGSFDFPLKSYGALVLPEGNYQAVRLLIGDSAGQNWWCVLFPPLCFIDGSGAQTNPLVKKDLPEENPSPEIKIRWKIVELMRDYKNLI